MSEQTWASALARACRGEGITSHYQPIIDTARGTVVGHEALARFPASAGASTPDTWFAVAREHGLVAPLEAAALRSALRRRPELPTNTFLTVNLGPDVLDEPEVQEVLAAEGSLAGLVIELTEHARVESYVALEPVLDRLRGDGALIALDDAGTGYAGLSHMLNIRPSFVKLDRSLVAGLEGDQAKQALVEMMGTLSGRLDAWLLAEGVETAAELDVLVGLGVPLVQGYHLGRPSSSWAELDLDIALRLATHGAATSRTEPATLRPLLGEAVAVGSPAEAGARFADDAVDHVVVVDEHHRPVASVGADSLVRSVRDGLRFNLDTPLTEAAHRAMSRGPEARLDPLVCTDNAGRYVGVVRVPVLLGALARLLDGTGHRLSA